MKRRRRLVRNPVSDGERVRISMLAEYGFHYKAIATRLYGKSDTRYVPSDGEVSRVGRVAREEGTSPMDWRRGTSELAKRQIQILIRKPIVHAKAG